MGKSRRLDAIRTTALSAVLLTVGLGAAPAFAQAQSYVFDIPAKPLAQALQDFARATDAQLLFSDALVAGRMAPPLQGRATSEEALARLLGDADLVARTTPSGAILILPRSAPLPQPLAVNEGGPPPDDTLDEVVVTGSRIAGAGPVGSLAVVLDRQAIDRAGRSNAADLIRTLPQNVSLGSSQETRGGVQASPNNLGFATGPNLRGLGLDATLSLVNGHRLSQANYGGFVDISQIPLLAVDRVEVVVDGASAIYGSDAVGGVVNFILRQNFDGLEAHGQAGLGDGFERYTLGAAAGRTWSNGQVFLALEYFKQSNLSSADRSYYTADLRRFGGPNLETANASPGNITAGGVSYAIPRGQNGVGLTAASLTPGTANFTPRWGGADILPQTEKFSAAGVFSQELTPGLTLTLDGLATRRKSVRRAEAYVATLTVPRANPFFVNPLPTATSTTVLYSFLGDYGAQATGGTSEDVSLHGVVEAQLPGRWRAELGGLISRNSVSFRNDDLPNTTLLNLALADPDPQTAFNPFGDAGSNAQSVLDRVRGYSDTFSRTSLESVGFDASGPLFELPAGEVRLALGAEVRRETLRTYSPRFTSGLAPTTRSSRLSRSIEAAYVEAYAPLVDEAAGLPGIRSLRLSAAVRAERYAGDQSTTNPKFGLQWEPVREVQVSATWGTSFKAPTLYQQDTVSNLNLKRTFVGSGLPGGQVDVIQLSGTSPGLKPETAETWTLGVTYQPRRLEGLRLSVNYFDIQYRDRILGATSQELLAALSSSAPSPLIVQRSPSASEVNAYFNAPNWNGPTVPAGQIYAIVDFRQNNLGRVEQSGFDVSAAYQSPTKIGTFGAELNFVYLDRYAVSRVAGSPMQDRRNTSNSPVDLTGLLRGTWRHGGWDAALTANYVAGYDNTTLAPSQDVSSWTTLDAHLAYDLGTRGGALAGVTLSLDVQNLFDRDPPRVANVTGPLGYDPELASALGRVVSFTVGKRW